MNNERKKKEIKVRSLRNVWASFDNNKRGETLFTSLALLLVIFSFPQRLKKKWKKIVDYSEN